MATTTPSDGSNTVCEMCNRSPSADTGMVACDNCDKWFHYKCVGVTEDIRNHSWICRMCRTLLTGPNPFLSPANSTAPSITSSVRRRRALDLELQRLEDERNIQEEYMRKRYEVLAVYLQDEDDEERYVISSRSCYSNGSRTRLWVEEQQRELGNTIHERVPAAESLGAIPKLHHNKVEELRHQFDISTPLGRPELRNRRPDPKLLALPLSNPFRPVPPSVGSVPLRQAPLPPSLQSDPSRFPPLQSTPFDDGNGWYPHPQRLPKLPETHASEEQLSYGETKEQIRTEIPVPVIPSLTQPPTLSRVHGLGPTAAQISARQVWPKKLPTFSGSPEEWPIFISSYENSNLACGFSNVENLVRLQESLHGPALEIVRSRLIFPANVPKIMETLRKVYGRPEILIRSLTAKVRNMDPPKADRLETVISFGLVVLQLCDHMEAANQQDHLRNPVLIQELVDKLPTSFKLEWVRFKKAAETVSLRTFGDFMDRLIAEASEVTFINQPKEAHPKLERKTPKEKGFLHTHSGAGIAVQNPKAEESRITDDKPCATCSRVGHRARNCEEFKEMTLAERLQLVERLKLCSLCLYDHGDMRCRNKFRCRVNGCEERHHPLLHCPEKSEESSCLVHRFTKPSVIFRVAPVTLTNGNRNVETYAFFDEGSSKTLLEKEVAVKLGVKGAVAPLDLKWTAGVSRTEKASMSVTLSVAGKSLGERHQLKEVHTVERLNLPKQSFCMEDLSRSFPHLQGVPIIDQSKAVPTILIGLHNIELLAPLESRIGKAGEPVALRCKLGWTICGPGEVDEAEGKTEAFCGLHQCDQELDGILRNYFTLEEAGVNSPFQVESVEDQRARSILEQTTVRVGNRYETGLLWRQDNVRLPDSYPMAYRRLVGLERRFAREPQLKEKVVQQVAEYVSKGYAHKASQEELSATAPGKSWYLPLNVVKNPRKPGKLRLTLDAAARAGGTCFNDSLLKGPDMLASLPSILNHFRERRIGFGADIREMFHQILVRHEDKQYQRFLFRTDPSCDPDIYVMDVVIFGAKCSPCCAHYAKNANAREHSAHFPEAAKVIEHRHYVDDYFDSADTEEEAAQRALEVRYVHSLGGFALHHWVSNSSLVLERLGESGEREKALTFDKTKESERVLGLLWKPLQDVFTFSMGIRAELIPYLTQDSRPTKRIILQCVMSFFDPIGFLSPLLIHGRIIIQETWRSGTEWDQPVTDEIFASWRDWTKVLAVIETIEIPRCYFGDEKVSDITSLQLHIFADASEKAYGCVAYLRFIVGDQIRCTLVGSKSKVAPLKMTSIPRMELQAAVLAARMMKSLLTSLSLPIQSQYIWVDSTTVLAWIRSDSRKYKPYVAHRIGEIMDTTEINSWMWVPTKQNVADLMTKWGPETALDASGRWFRGPSFLCEAMDRWPKQPNGAEDTKEELRAYSLFHHTSTQEPVVDVSRFSKWKILLRSVALVYRFIWNCKRKVAGLPIIPVCFPVTIGPSTRALRVLVQQEELVEAENLLWRIGQGEVYSDEVKILMKNKELPPEKQICIGKSSQLYKLSPYLDEDNVIRMEGRTAAAMFADVSTRFPVVLPKGHLITTKLIEDYHVRFGHGSKEMVVNEVRQRFYIPNLRTAVQSVIKSCLKCKIRRSKPDPPRMAPLSVQRLQPYVRPFSYVGLDYFGPINVTVGRNRIEKRYVALFTCLVTRAVHCEVAHSLTAESCKLAVRRFVKRYGSPVEIFSDNGTNFQRLSRELQQEIRDSNEDCASTFTDARTKWSFNPPSAPHMGGAWERMVRAVKEVMDALDDGRKMTDEILLTVLAEAVYLVNARPLTYAGTEDSEFDAITPNHFLIGDTSGQHQPFRVPVSLAEELKSSYKRSQHLSNEFWARWCKEYFPTLNQRSKWYNDSKPIKVGDLVLVRDDYKGGASVRGIVDEIFTGVDGRVRQALVRTSTGSFKRPVAKLAVLELDDEPDTSSIEGDDHGSRAGECSNHQGSTILKTPRPENDGGR